MTTSEGADPDPVLAVQLQVGPVALEPRHLHLVHEHCCLRLLMVASRLLVYRHSLLLLIASKSNQIKIIYFPQPIRLFFHNKITTIGIEAENDACLGLVS